MEATEPKWKKISSKKYQRLTAEGEWATVDMPYGKVEELFAAFIGNGGLINTETGMVATDLPTLINSFGIVGDIVLTEYDKQGEVVVKGNRKILDPSEIPTLFLIATDVINSFIEAISTMQGAMAMAGQEEKAPKKTPRTKE